jgi:hypothetical protein
VYYAFSGYEFAKRVIINNIRESFRDAKKFYGDIIKRGVVRPDEWKYDAAVFYTRLRGLFIGTMHYVKEIKLRITDGAGSFY